MVLFIACTYNRPDTTRSCLYSLYSSIDHTRNQFDYKIIINDCSNNDSTEKMLISEFMNVDLIRGKSNMYWNQAMLSALSYAISRYSFDYVAFFNDDVVFDLSAINHVLEQSSKCNECIVAGLFRDQDYLVSYGGLIRSSKFNKLKFRHSRHGYRESCYTLNMNFCLVPKSQFLLTHKFTDVYRHSLGDLDFGLDFTQKGGKIFSTPDFIGVCARNPINGSWKDPQLGISKRLKLILSVKGMPLYERLYFYKKFGSLLWPIFFAVPYLSVLIPFKLIKR